MSPDIGDTVRVEYVGRTQDGEMFDTSREEVAREADVYDPDREYGPLTVTIGEGEVVEGFEAALLELSEGETTTVTVPPEQGYGRKMTDRVIQYELETFDDALADDKAPEEGMRIASDEGIEGEIIDVTDKYVMVDFNHDLAGETLEFEIELLEVLDR